jgi:hypothetical protein
MTTSAPGICPLAGLPGGPGGPAWGVPCPGGCLGVPGGYWAIVTVDDNVESKWSTRKARVEVVGDITHLSLELIAN